MGYKSSPLQLKALCFILGLILVSAGCAPDRIEDPANNHAANDRDHEEETGADALLTLPELAPVALAGEPLRVVASTSIIGDIVGQVGGDKIQLSILMGPGEDPHSFEPAARELTAVASAHLIFINGWDLEEGLVDDLENIAEDVSILPISANIQPLAYGDAPDHVDEGNGEADHAHGSIDPHVWFSIHHVEQWVENVARVLTQLDPANDAAYAANAAAYLTELAALEAYAQKQLGTIPAHNRVLVTNHDTLGYFAHDYDFEILGTVIPGASTLAEPSASKLSALVNRMAESQVCTIFTDATVSDALARTAAAELNNCSSVAVLSLYTGSIGAAGSGADSYLGMIRHNIDAIVAGLKE